MVADRLLLILASASASRALFELSITNQQLVMEIWRFDINVETRSAPTDSKQLRQTLRSIFTAIKPLPLLAETCKFSIVLHLESVVHVLYPIDEQAALDTITALKNTITSLLLKNSDLMLKSAYVANERDEAAAMIQKQVKEAQEATAANRRLATELRSKDETIAQLMKMLRAQRNIELPNSADKENIAVRPKLHVPVASAAPIKLPPLKAPRGLQERHRNV